MGGGGVVLVGGGDEVKKCFFKILMIKFLLHRDGRRYFKMCNPFAVQNKLLQQVTFGAVFLVTLSKLFKNVRDFLKFRYCCIHFQCLQQRGTQRSCRH